MQHSYFPKEIFFLSILLSQINRCLSLSTSVLRQFSRRAFCQIRKITHWLVSPLIPFSLFSHLYSCFPNDPKIAPKVKITELLLLCCQLAYFARYFSKIGTHLDEKTHSVSKGFTLKFTELLTWYTL